MYPASNHPHSNGHMDAQSAKQTTAHCASCDIEILWPPTVVQDKTYCCTGCAAQGPCTCDYSQYLSVNIAGSIHYVPEKPAEQH